MAFVMSIMLPKRLKMALVYRSNYAKTMICCDAVNVKEKIKCVAAWGMTSSY